MAGAPIRLRRSLSGFVPSIAAPPGLALMPLWQARPIALHRLLQLAYAEGGGTVGDFDQWWPALVEDNEFDPALVLIAADPDGQPLGLAQCWTSGFLKDLVVAPEARNQRVGSWLLDRVFNAFAARGLPHVDLKVEPDNISAQRFYARYGMVAVEG